MVFAVVGIKTTEAIGLALFIYTTKAGSCLLRNIGSDSIFQVILMMFTGQALATSFDCSITSPETVN